MHPAAHDHRRARGRRLSRADDPPRRPDDDRRAGRGVITRVFRESAQVCRRVLYPPARRKMSVSGRDRYPGLLPICEQKQCRTTAADCLVRRAGRLFLSIIARCRYEELWATSTSSSRQTIPAVVADMPAPDLRHPVRQRPARHPSWPRGRAVDDDLVDGGLAMHQRQMTAHSADGGKALAHEAEVMSKATFKVLHEYLPHLIRAASDHRKPFPGAARGKFALQNMLTGPMSAIPMKS